MYYERPTRRMNVNYERDGRRMPPRYRDYGYDYDYEDRYERDDIRRLTKEDAYRWKRGMRNVDGSVGEHFTRDQIMRHAEQLGVRYDGYSESDLCIAANMLYSDYAEALRPYVPADKEATAYVRMAKAFLEDEDAPEGSEKLALYYRYIVNGDDI